MILGIIAGLASLLVVLLLWVLLAQISILADTYRNEYYLSFGGVGKAELVPLPDDILIRVRFAFLTKEFYPLHFSPEKKKKKAKAEKPEKRKREKAFPFRRAIRLLKSFNIKYFRLEVDTDDYIWNAYLWPVVYWIRPLRRHINVNFQGRNECRLLIQNRIWRMAWAWFFG
ncbi:MAG: hypothetical protein J5I94_15990 [Phaeodactylibacter sp.]|nr:hypothetical protein [Phaeodactylibacter sp.]